MSQKSTISGNGVGETSKGKTSVQLWSVAAKFLKLHKLETQESSDEIEFNLNEEYLRACRTNSYVEFAAKVERLTFGGSSSSEVESFDNIAMKLLEPDQEVVIALLNNKDMRKRPDLLKLVDDYFNNSLRASTLCGILLKCINQARDRYTNVKAIIELISSYDIITDSDSLSVFDKLRLYADEDNPFSDDICDQFSPLHSSYLEMQRQLEKKKGSTENKLKYIRGLLKVCMVFLLAGCTLLFIVTMAAVILALAALVIGRKAVFGPFRYIKKRASNLSCSRRDSLERQWGQLDAAAQGTFIVIQDLNTIKRLAKRLGNEVDFTLRTIAFWDKHREDNQILRGAFQQLKKNQSVLNELLDDLEQNVYLCFMSINRVRGLVIQKISLH